jgi:O-antigen/teichoic acid export membrane protein
MPGAGRPGDPLWTAIGFMIGIVPGIYFHQIGAALGIGIALGVALGLIREDRRRGYRRPADPLWFCIGLLIGLGAGVCLHFLGLRWFPSLALGLALGLVFGAVAGTIRADRRRVQEQDNLELAKRYRDSC